MFLTLGVLGWTHLGKGNDTEDDLVLSSPAILWLWSVEGTEFARPVVGVGVRSKRLLAGRGCLVAHQDKCRIAQSHNPCLGILVETLQDSSEMETCSDEAQRCVRTCPEPHRTGVISQLTYGKKEVLARKGKAH